MKMKQEKIINYLFNSFIKVSENIFSKELYINIDQIKMMINCGMHIGAHGYNHFWLGKLDNIEQENEIIKSIVCVRAFSTNRSSFILPSSILPQFQVW